MRPAIAILLAACVPALAGCGAASSSAEDFKGEEKAVAEVVEDLQDASASNDPTKICRDILATSLVRQIEQSGNKCADELSDSIDDADDTELDVVGVTVSGATARATVKGSGTNEDRRSVISFVRQGNSWRASAIASAGQPR